ncbi:MAG: hypothetical protein QN174_13320, partial [Armatimonadota bacterium]|nr:hypothetical protein [Armatimonadota bacterium]
MKYEWSDKIGNRSLQQLASAAEPYLADQATASDPRCGLVQPITVAEAEALAIALQQAWQVLQRSTAGTRLERRRVPGTARRPARAGRTASRQDGMVWTASDGARPRRAGQ